MKNQPSQPQTSPPQQTRGEGSSVRPCVSWRQSGGFWSIHEDGEGDRLRISNSVRDIELAELNDEDLEILQHLIATAIGFRKIHWLDAGGHAPGTTALPGPVWKPCAVCGKSMIRVHARDFDGFACMSTALCTYKEPSLPNAIGDSTLPANGQPESKNEQERG